MLLFYDVFSFVCFGITIAIVYRKMEPEELCSCFVMYIMTFAMGERPLN